VETAKPGPRHTPQRHRHSEGATVTIDGKPVESESGSWEGRLPLGEHTLEVAARGDVTVTQTLRLERRKQPQLNVAFTRPEAWCVERAAECRRGGPAARRR